MFSRGLSSVLSKVLTRPASRDQSLSSQATRSSLSDPFDVELAYGWSDTTLGSVHTRYGPAPTPTSSRSLPGLSSITGSLVKEHPNQILGSEYSSLSNLKSLSDLESSISSFCDRDDLNAPLNALVRSPDPLTEVVESTYGRRLPMFVYKGESTSSAPSQSFRYQTPLISPRSPFLTLPPSPTSSTRTRPLFLPSPSPAPLQLEETYISDTSIRKRKDRPTVSSDAFINRSKRHRTELDIIDIDNDGDEDDDDDWNPGLINTGYQSDRTPPFSIEHTPTLGVDSSAVYSEALESDGEDESWISRNQRPRTPQVLAPPRDVIAWSGQEGGAIKFKTKPPRFNEKAFSRWSYSATGPKSSTVSERTDGDIHFSPSNGIGTNEPFNYWVCVRNDDSLRWVNFSCGQPHPLYLGYVLKPVNVVTKAPPKWVKAASYKASRE